MLPPDGAEGSRRHVAAQPGLRLAARCADGRPVHAGAEAVVPLHRRHAGRQPDAGARGDPPAGRRGRLRDAAQPLGPRAAHDPRQDPRAARHPHGGRGAGGGEGRRRRHPRAGRAAAPHRQRAARRPQPRRHRGRPRQDPRVPLRALRHRRPADLAARHRRPVAADRPLHEPALSRLHRLAARARAPAADHQGRCRRTMPSRHDARSRAISATPCPMSRAWPTQPA